jgi:glycosyltransferase involved in cell wall biosynthesis/peptidoglycan/xylan/chitin deacetylase (PgdA/CDA1 family)
MYHRVSEVVDDGRHTGLISATPSEFARQLDVLCDRFRPVSGGDAIDALTGKRTLPRQAVLLTFDDAVDDFEHHALPSLRSHSVPAMLFVPTAYVGRPEAVFWWDALHAAITKTAVRASVSTPIGSLPMSTEADRRTTFRRLRDHCKEIPQAELDALVADLSTRLDVVQPPARVMGWDALEAVHAEGLVAVCPHGRTHAHLDQLTPDQLEREIRGSFDDLELVLGPVPPAFAYPSGRIGPDAKRIAAEAGVQVAFSTRTGVERIPAADPLAVRRVHVSRRAGLTGARLRAAVDSDRRAMIQGLPSRRVTQSAVRGARSASPSQTASASAVEPGRFDDPPIVRVAMVITSWHAQNLGGAERQLESLCPLLVERRIEPVVIGRLRPGATPHQSPVAQVVHIRVPGIPGLDSAVFLWGALRALSRVEPDVVHAFSAFSQSAVARLHKRRTGTPFLTKILRSGPLGDLYRLRRKPFGGWRLARIAREADAFVVISQEIDDELADLGIEPQRRLRIPNGVDLDRFAPATDRAPSGLVESIGDGPVVVAVGRRSPEKRLRELSEHWHLVVAEHPDARLVILGKLVNRVDLRAVELADDPHIVQLGARSDIENAYRAADVYVSASVAEGLSNALLEAMATGLPCVVTRAGGVADVIEDGANGLIVPPDDIPALTAAINKLLADPALARELGRRARETVSERFGLPRIADELATQYRRLAAERRDGRLAG